MSIAAANGQEPALDVTVKSDPAHWAERARRSGAADRIGARDRARAGAAPAGLRRRRVVGAGRGGGVAGAAPRRRRAANRSPTSARRPAARPRSSRPPARASPRSIAPAPRLERLKQNLARLGLDAETVAADVTEWQSEPFDAVLLDAPCSATGTIRRHPDIPWLKRESDIATLAALQRRLLARAVELTRPGGLIVYCTCSLEPEEGVEPVDRAAGGRFPRAPTSGCGGRGAWPRRVPRRRRRPAHAALPTA